MSGLSQTGEKRGEVVGRDSGKPPIFIIGSPRSGTTLLRMMLDAHPGISCGPETHFLTDLERILSRHWEGIKLYGFSEEYWFRRIASFFDTFKMDYARQKGKTRWADKTPGYTRRLDFITALFPTCQLVHLIRDGRDVVASHLYRWGFKRALHSIGIWRVSVEQARRMGRQLGPRQFHELRYEDLVSEPGSSVQELLDFLGEPWDPIVLDYMRAEHDYHARHDEFTAKRRSQGGEESLIYDSRVGAWRRELGLPLRILIRLRAGSLLRELGYT